MNLQKVHGYLVIKYYFHRNFDWKKNNDFEDDIKIIDNNKDIFNINVFIKLLKAAQNLNNFESHKIFIFSYNKKRNMHNFNAN